MPYHEGGSDCPILCLTKVLLFAVTVFFILYLPLGDPSVVCNANYCDADKINVTPVCSVYDGMLCLGERTLKVMNMFARAARTALYEGKLKLYSMLSKYDHYDYCRVGACVEDEPNENPTKKRFPCPCKKSKRIMRDVRCQIWLYVFFSVILVLRCKETGKDEIDRVIEDELTNKLGEDLLQSIQKKFEVDLERSVDMVLVKIRLLLQNGTVHIQDRLKDIQSILEGMKKDSANEVDRCLLEKQNETSALAEKALHQMVVCGYALIGHDPAEAVKKVMALKTMIVSGIKALHEQKPEVLSLLKVCGHDHDSLKKVIKCVISKSPSIKTAMMDITGKLIGGVVTLTKLVAHGAMHEACLIEVIKTTEDEVFQLVKQVQNCVYGNTSTTDTQEVENYIKENNATVLDVGLKTSNKAKKLDENVKEMLRRMLAEDDVKDLDDFRRKLSTVHAGDADNEV